MGRRKSSWTFLACPHLAGKRERRSAKDLLRPTRIFWAAAAGAGGRSGLPTCQRRATDPLFDDDAVFLRQHARRIVRRDADASEQGPIAIGKQSGQRLQAWLVLDIHHALDAAAAGDFEQ